MAVRHRLKGRPRDGPADRQHQLEARIHGQSQQDSLCDLPLGRPNDAASDTASQIDLQRAPGALPRDHFLQ